jgi:ABC-type dipeptide/oligopeptide/nickel transport system permease subunit
VTCRRTAALIALIAALPLAAVGTVLLAEAELILALANSQVAAPAGARWLFVIAVAICLGASLYFVGSGAYRAVRSWGSLVRFAAQSFTTFGVSSLVLLIGFVFVVVATALGGGFF